MKLLTISMSLLALFAVSSCTKGCKAEQEAKEPTHEAPAHKEEVPAEAPAEVEKHEEAHPGHEKAQGHEADE